MFVYIANEAISITENIAIIGVPVPKYLVNALKKLKEENDDIEAIKLE